MKSYQTPKGRDGHSPVTFRIPLLGGGYRIFHDLKKGMLRGPKPGRFYPLMSETKGNNGGEVAVSKELWIGGFKAGKAATKRSGIQVVGGVRWESSPPRTGKQCRRASAQSRGHRVSGRAQPFLYRGNYLHPEQVCPPAQLRPIWPAVMTLNNNELSTEIVRCRPSTVFVV